MSGSDRWRVTTNSLVYSLANVAGHAYVFITLPLLTSNLTAEEFGFYIILVQIVTFIQTLGATLFGQSLFRHHVNYDGEEKRAFVSTLLLSSLGLTIFLVVLLMVGRDPLITGLYPNVQQPYSHPILLAGAWATLVTLRSFGMTFLKAQERPQRVLVQNLLYGALLIASLVFFVWYSNRGLVGALEALLVAEALAQVVMFVDMRRFIGFIFNRREFRRALSFSWPLSIGSMVILVFINIDRIILSHYVSLAEIGIYGFGLMLGNIVALVVTAFVSSYSARLIKVHKNSGADGASVLANTLIRDNVRLVGFATAGVLLCASLLVVVLGQGEGFSGSVLVVCGIALGHFVRSIYLFYQNGLFLHERRVAILGLSIGLLAIGSGLTWMFAVNVGIIGVAFVPAITYAAMIPMAKLTASRSIVIELPVSNTWRTSIVLGLVLACEYLIYVMPYHYDQMYFLLLKLFEIGLIVVTWGPSTIEILRRLSRR